MSKTDPEIDAEQLRLNVAEANGIEFFKKYSEAEAAKLLGEHVQTLKKRRLACRIDHLRIGNRNIAYFGFMLADHLIGSIVSQNQVNPSTGSMSTGSQSGQTRKPSTDSGTMPTQDSHAALHLARQTLKKPNKL